MRKLELYLGYFFQTPIGREIKTTVKIRIFLFATFSPWVRKSRYWGEMLLSPIHCCDVTKPP